LTPGRYVGAEEIDEEDDPFEDRIKRLVAKLATQFVESRKLEDMISDNLRTIFHGS